MFKYGMKMQSQTIPNPGMYQKCANTHCAHKYSKKQKNDDKISSTPSATPFQCELQRQDYTQQTRFQFPPFGFTVLTLHSFPLLT